MFRLSSDRLHSDWWRARRPEGRTSPGRQAFTILELQVAVGVLMAGLFGTVSLLSLQGKQLNRAAAWCQDEPTYYVVSQSNRWLRKLEASAEVKSEAGQEAWSPPVIGPQEYELDLDSCVVDLDGQQIDIGTNRLDAGE